MNTKETHNTNDEGLEKPIERAGSWIRNSVTIKLITITALMLLLLIPTSMIQSIIWEREQLSNEATKEVSNKWASAQEINGPILTIPITYEKIIKGEPKEYRKYWNILPKDLNINGKVDPQKLKRGIYEVIVYRSDLAISGKFSIEPKLDTNQIKAIHYDQAFLTVGITDLRGIKNRIKIKWNNQLLGVEPGSKLASLIYSGVTVKLPVIDASASIDIPFEFDLDLKGSQHLSFVPIGGNTEVTIESPWDSPSFNGGFLPDERTVSNSGFKANWKILQLNRNFPRSWVAKADQQATSTYASNFKDSTFGFSLIVPVDNYQKSMRSAKYAVMTIALTFLIFFLVEILSRRKIHPFQYALVGLALCIFYVLLVSITEHSNFNIAYGASTLGIVSIVSLYSLSVFKVKKFTLLLIAVLMGIYGFLFVTLQLTDYALLMGSIGLLLILAATMYFTRNINWYQLNFDNK